MSPVPPPSSLLLEGHVSGDARLREALGPAAASLAADRATLAAKAASLDDLIVSGAPTHFVAMLDTGGFRLGPRVQWVASIGLSSYDEALARCSMAAKGASLERNGRRWLWAGAPGGPCALARAPEPAPARFMCGPRAALERAGPYLARTLGAQTSEVPELYARMPVRALSEQHGPLLEGAKPVLPSLLGDLVSARNPALGRWLAPALPTLVEEGLGLVADVHELEARAALDDTTLVLSARAVLAGKRSWTGSALRQARDTAAIPDAFWRLPADTDLAWFGSRVPEARAKELAQFLDQTFRGVLGPSVGQGVHGADGRHLRTRRAHGVRPRRRLRRRCGHKTRGGERLRRQMMSTYGWHIMGFEAPASEYLPRLVAGMNAYNSGDLRAMAYRELPRLCRGLGPITQRAGGAKLPKGSVVFEMKLPGKFFDECWESHREKSRDRSKDAALVVIMVPAGPRTWIGISPDEAGLSERLSTAAGAGTGKMLGDDKRPALLTEQSLLAGGFVTLQGSVACSASWSSASCPGWYRRRLALLAQSRQDQDPVFSDGDAKRAASSALPRRADPRSPPGPAKPSSRPHLLRTLIDFMSVRRETGRNLR